MKILLTGAKGNLGQALQRNGRQHQWVELNRGDWSNIVQLGQGSDLVIHAASDTLTPVWKNPNTVMDSNVVSLVRLLENFPKRARLVFVSSCAVYGHSENTREDTEPAPISINGISKLLNEAFIREYCGYHGISYQIFRVFNIFGGSDRFSILSHLLRAARESKPFTMYNKGISKRDFVHVDDAAHVMLTLIENPVAYPILNIGSGEAVSIQDIVSEFQKRFPSLEIVNAERFEAKYSRSDNTLLNRVLPSHKFSGVLEFIRRELIERET